jgi:uncharacterized protein (TIGR00106 family)
MLANVSFVPIGVGAETNQVVAKAVRLIHRSGVQYQLTSTGIILEGSWVEIFDIIKKCRDEIRKCCDRVVTNISVDDYTGAQDMPESI